MTKRALRIIGIVAVLLGLVWIGQGTGYFPYPKSSYMISQTPWAYRGAVLAAAGVVVLIVVRKRTNP